MVGSLWTFATTSSSFDVGAFSFVAGISNEYDQLNGLFDDTMNDICHQIYAYATSNESFTYSQMLKEKDHMQFFEAMEIELADHESRQHWALMRRNDLPSGVKTIMVIWSFR